MTAQHAVEAPTTERWSALGGVLLSALYLWVIVWLLLAVLLPSLGLGWKPVVITTGSMQPLIRPGDVVLTAEAPELEPGQVITYEDPARPGTLTTHRVVSLNDDGTLRTQGDANPTPDSTAVPGRDVVGRGRLLVPLVGLPLVWLSSGAVLFGLWVVVTAISVAVVAGASGRGGPPPPSRGVATRRALQRLVPLVQAARPRAVQQTVVRALARQVQKVHDRVYRGYRPNPSRLRRGTPSLALLALTVGLARTPAMVALGVVALVAVLLFDPDGPQFRIGRWERLAVRSVRAVTAVVPPALGARGVLVVAMVVAVGASSVGRSAATFSAAADNSGSSFTAASAFPTDDLTLYLQNDPEGQDTTDQFLNPMTGTVPTQATLPNYDTDVDADPGVTLRIGATDPYESDGRLVQRWRYPVTEDLTVASAQVVWHSAVRDFDPARAATVDWYVGHCAPGYLDCVVMASAGVTEADWQAGAPGFTERTTAFGTISHVVPAGRELVLVVTVPTADRDLWLAYDTAAQPSRLEITAASPGVCPGSGSSMQWVAADTMVEQGDPDANFSTGAFFGVVAATAENHRALFTMELPVVPDGCTLTSATLRVTTQDSTLGRTIVAQRTDSAFDPATVTWNNQPATSGPTSSSASTPVGPTPLDVTAPVEQLYLLGNTGIQLRDAGEGDGSGATNRYTSIESEPYPDPEGPRLEVTWGP